MFAAMRPEDSLGILGGISAGYLLLIFFLLWRTQAFELKLLVLGLVTALLAVWCGQLGMHAGATVQVGPAPTGQVGRVVIGDDVAGTLGRIALLLVLGGIALGILGRCASPASTQTREEAIREQPK